MRYICLLVVTFMVSCSNEDILKEMEEIKAIGDENPKKALVMLDSLEIEIRGKGEYAKHKYDLLRVRLNDKADHIPSSDIMIKRLMVYFEKKGSVPEKQEVYYYAGSTYRDLQDTPRALEYFFKSLDFALDGKGCDSIMLRNTYSNLNYLYFRVQDYTNALDVGIKEVETCKKTGGDVTLPYMHVGTAYLALDSFHQAEIAFDSAFVHASCSADIPLHQEMLGYLLCHYSAMGNVPKAKACYALMDKAPLKDLPPYPCMSFAKYYEALGMTDSAVIYGRQLLEDRTDIYNMYDAAKFLFELYSRKGDTENAIHYAGIYLQFSDSIDFGKRQELAATVNNAYQYHLDQKKEQKLKDEKERYWNMLLFVSLTALLSACIGYIFHVRRRDRHLQEIVALSAELQRFSADDSRLRGQIEKKEKELTESRTSLEKSSEELNQMKQELQRVNEELTKYSNTLKEKEQRLAEKIEQNKAIVKQLHLSELEGRAADVIHAVRLSSSGKKKMTPANWKQLYQAVDELFPSFKDRLVKEVGTFTEQQMQVCYLIRIGLSNQQIQNMTSLSHSTVWRWVKKYDWVITTED